MLVLLYGDDRARIHDHIETLCGGVSYQSYDDETIDYEFLIQSIQGTDLFAAPTPVVIYGLLEKKSGQDFFQEYADRMHAHRTPYIFVEHSLTTPFKKKIIQTTPEIHEYTLPKDTNKSAFNVFALNDAYASRDKKKMWILFHEALRSGMSAEEIHGLLWWQIKNIAVVCREGINPGLHNFVFEKTKRACKLFPVADIEAHSTALYEIFHESRRGGTPLDVSLEMFILNM
ncbi:MAG: hypothetical protein LRY41_01500 [Candidatus Pacebacteria bacterium]|nr:hypothetical protein [Candidatus Paceibacterota bacterium]MCD8508431.1 hypothetical protein [Candidatus Paceibacterota bacterium]MCD8527988.1 hypothetical protein [Candidatus Paceibacterota bacterium]MCD8563927.1 hypothetical protein [Candidatus Paceibacterota bacterium]